MLSKKWTKMENMNKHVVIMVDGKPLSGLTNDHIKYVQVGANYYSKDGNIVVEEDDQKVGKNFG